jgi:hypothetical protein
VAQPGLLFWLAKLVALTQPWFGGASYGLLSVAGVVFPALLLLALRLLG